MMAAQEWGPVMVARASSFGWQQTFKRRDLMAPTGENWFRDKLSAPFAGLPPRL